MSATNKAEQVQPVVYKDQHREGSTTVTNHYYILTHPGMVEKFRKKPKEISVQDVVAIWDVFKGQGRMNDDRASRKELRKTFNTNTMEEACLLILEKGELEGVLTKNKKALGSD